MRAVFFSRPRAPLNPRPPSVPMGLLDSLVNKRARPAADAAARAALLLDRLDGAPEGAAQDKVLDEVTRLLASMKVSGGGRRCAWWWGGVRGRGRGRGVRNAGCWHSHAAKKKNTLDTRGGPPPRPASPVPMP